jgi:hypothetical protein
MPSLKTDDRIRAWCDERGLKFAPHEVHPADADNGPSPWPAGAAGAVSWPKAQKMRQKIIAEIQAA